MSANSTRIRKLVMVYASQLPSRVSHVERIPTMDDVGIVLQRNLLGVLIDFVSVILHVREAHLIQTVATGSDTVVHGQHHDLLIPGYVSKSTVQDVDDNVCCPTVTKSFVTL